MTGWENARVARTRRTGAGENQVEPHGFEPQGWRRWICRHCYGPKTLHPRLDWKRARPLGDHRYLSPRAPHFREGW